MGLKLLYVYRETDRGVLIGTGHNICASMVVYTMPVRVICIGTVKKFLLNCFM